MLHDVKLFIMKLPSEAANLASIYVTRKVEHRELTKDGALIST
jgi:hypothetical protein